MASRADRISERSISSPGRIQGTEATTAIRRVLESMRHRTSSVIVHLCLAWFTDRFQR